MSSVVTGHTLPDLSGSHGVCPRREHERSRVPSSHDLSLKTLETIADLVLSRFTRPVTNSVSGVSDGAEVARPMHPTYKYRNPIGVRGFHS